MDNPTPERQSAFINLQTKMAIGFSLLAIISTGILTIIFIVNSRARILTDLRTHLREAVSIGALSIDGDTHSTLVDASQEDNINYQDLKEQFQRIRDAGTDFRHVYSLRRVKGVVQFIVDAEENPEDGSQLGDVYVDIPEDIANLIPTMNEAVVNEEYHEDFRGTWLTGYAPIYTSDQTIDAVLAIDIPVDKIRAYQTNVIWNMILVYLLTIPLVALVAWYLGRMLSRPILTLIDGAKRLEAGDFRHQVVVKTQDEIEILASSFNSIGERLGGLVSSLESMVEARTAELEKRSVFLRAAAEVSQDVITILDPVDLIPHVVELIRDRFNLYYVGLFLVDEDQEWAVLQAGTGEPGKIMLEQGYRIRIGEGMIGWCIDHKQARVAMEAEQDTVRLVIPLLPYTRSEAALPLRSRGKVFGALTMQSDQPGVFDEATLAVLQTMVDQVGIALDNARLFSEREEALQSLNRSMREYSQQAWGKSIQSRAVVGYHGDARGITPIVEDGEIGQEQYLREKTESDSESAIIQVPIKIRDYVIGVIEARKPSVAGEWSQDEIRMMNTLIDQLGVALENARHYEESQQRADRERILAEITGRVRSSTNINSILQIAVQELSEALQVPRGAIRLLKTDIGFGGSGLIQNHEGDGIGNGEATNE